MKRVTMIGWAAVVAVLATACGEPTGEPVPADGGVLAAELVYFDADHPGAGELGAISDQPIDMGAVLSWSWEGSTSDGADIETRPGTSYVVVGVHAGWCRESERAELVRLGDELSARIIGGEQDRGPVPCIRSFEAVAQFAVSADAVRGVRTINGREPVDPNGPGKLEEFVELGASAVPDGVRPAKLGTTAASELYQALERVGSTNLDRARATLAATPPPDRRGYAFVLQGCAQDGAVLIIGRHEVQARLTGGENIQCDAPNYFLATLSVERGRITRHWNRSQHQGNWSGDATVDAIVALGTAPVADGVRQARLGTPQANELYRALERAGSTNLDRARAALAATPPPGRDGLAFVLVGCAEDAEDGATAVVLPSGSVEVWLTGGSGEMCLEHDYLLAAASVDQ